MEVSEYLVGSPAFKAGGTGDPRTAGSIPVHLRFRRGVGSGRCAPSTDLRTVHPGPERPVAEGDKSGGNTRELRRMIRRGAPIGKAH